MNGRHRHFALLSRIAFLVAVGDFVTKEAAARWLSREASAAGSWLHFAVVHNERAAFGVSLGQYTWHLNLALTLAAIALVIPVSADLARVDRGAPRALGLIVGGALGNLISLLLSPRGVVDFISLNVGDDSAIVLNVADVAAYVGLAMVVRTGYLIVAAMRREVPRAIVVDPTHDAPVLVSLALGDREVSRPVYREPVLSIDSALASAAPDEPRQATARVLAFPSPAGDRTKRSADTSAALELPPPPST